MRILKEYSNVIVDEVGRNRSYLFLMMVGYEVL